MSRATFTETRPYALLAATLLEQGKIEEAWEQYELSRCRVLTDLLDISGQSELSKKEKTKRSNLLSDLAQKEVKLAVLRKRVRSSETEESRRLVEEARTNLLEAEARWSKFDFDISSKYPASEGHSFSLERIQSSLDEKSAVIGWLDSEIEPGVLSSWGYVIKHTGPVTWIRLPQTPTSSETGKLRSLSQLAEEVRVTILFGQQSEQGIPSSLRALARIRLDPLQPELLGINNLVISQAGVMSTIPVEALPDDQGQLMVDRFEISYTPSATIYAWLNEQGNERTKDQIGDVLLIGDPPFSPAQALAMNTEDSDSHDPLALAGIRAGELARGVVAGSPESISSLPRLHGARAEVISISHLAPHAKLLVGTDASELNLKKMLDTGELATYDVIHLATHTFVDDEKPEKSCLVLSCVDLPDAFAAVMGGERVYDGRLTLLEILREWDIRADLVTLSACETGLGKSINGEGTVGFAHAFFQAGASSLIVSLWRVSDAATSLLMERFYRNYWERGLSKGASLKDAKTWLRDFEDELGRRPYQHPFFWSGFILVGTSE